MHSCPDRRPDEQGSKVEEEIEGERHLTAAFIVHQETHENCHEGEENAGHKRG